MFSNVVVGVKEREAGRDALFLARILISANGKLTLARVQVVAPRPAPDSGAAGAEARRRDALERLAALRDESQLDAEMVCVEAPSVRRGLHDLARARDADLLVIAASRQDEIYRDLVADDARELLEAAPCTVAVAPVGYHDRGGSLRRIGVAYDGSPGSARALDVARTLAADQPTKLSAFHAVSGPGRIEDTVDDEVAHALERIASWAGLTATPSTARQRPNCDATDARSTSSCSVRTSTARSVVSSDRARPSGWSTSRLARSSWSRKTDRGRYSPRPRSRERRLRCGSWSRSSRRD